MFEIREPLTIPLKGQKIFAVRHEPLIRESNLVVLFLHGFGGNKIGKHSLYVEMSMRLAEKGIASLRFDFRGSGDSEGLFEEQTLTDLLLDAETVYDFLKADRVAIIGTSMGGLVASLLTARKKIAAVVLWAPVFDGHQWLAEWDRVPIDMPCVMHKGRLVSRKMFEELFAIAEKDIQKGITQQPLLCFKCQKDETLNEGHIERYQKICPEGTFVTLGEADHSFSSYKDRMVLQQKTADWLYQIARFN